MRPHELARRYRLPESRTRSRQCELEHDLAVGIAHAIRANLDRIDLISAASRRLLATGSHRLTIRHRSNRHRLPERARKPSDSRQQLLAIPQTRTSTNDETNCVQSVIRWEARARPKAGELDDLKSDDLSLKPSNALELRAQRVVRLPMQRRRNSSSPGPRPHVCQEHRLCLFSGTC
jgi:hypothetical protein